jgi:hypothetical protein
MTFEFFKKGKFMKKSATRKILGASAAVLGLSSVLFAGIPTPGLQIRFPAQTALSLPEI